MFVCIYDVPDQGPCTGFRSDVECTVVGVKMLRFLQSPVGGPDETISP